jgi:transglutaminase-like putative cysteine protease
MRITVRHITRYRYVQEATYSIQSLRLTPCAFDGQHVVEWSIRTRPGSEMTSSRDAFGNVVHLQTLTTPHREIEIVSAGTVETENSYGVVRGLDDPMPLRVYLRRTPLTEPSPEIVDLLESADEKKQLTRLHELMNLIRDRVDYLVGATDFTTTAGQAVAAGKGVCQDHAHIFIAAARHAKIPARYVTGYLLLEGDDQAVEAEAHHAWAEAWVENLGWVGFDVANRICPTDKYIRIAAGLDAQYASPLRGSHRGGAGETLEVSVTVAQAMAQQ